MRLLNRFDLQALGIKFSRQHLKRLIKAGKFPRPIKPGTGTNGPDAWINSEINEYFVARIAARDSQPPVKPTEAVTRLKSAAAASTGQPLRST